MLSEKLKGASLSDLQELEQDDVVDMLGIPLTMARVKCAILPLEAAKGAIRIS
jgi:nitrogen fixation NifU-like protein